MRILRLLATFSLAACVWSAQVQMDEAERADFGQPPSSAAATPAAINTVTNAASFAPGPLAPGALIAIDGSNLADAPVSAPDDGVHSLPSKLGGVEAIFDGIVLPLLSVSPIEVRAQLSYNLGNIAAGTIYVRTEHADGTVTVTNVVGVKIAAANPGIFALGGQEPRSGLVVHAEAGNQPGAPVTSENPAVAGQVVVLWAAGLGAVNTAGTSSAPTTGVPFAGPDAQVAVSVQAIVAGEQADVFSAILPAGSIGVYEILVLLPNDLLANAATTLRIVQNGFVSNTVIFPVVR